MPGPLLAANISQVARRGFWASSWLVLGHGVAELAVVVALGLGLSRWLSSGVVPRAIGLGGGLFLLVMGFSLIKGRGGWMEPGPANPHRRSPLLLGALVSLANPYWFLWWATVGSQYILWSLALGTLGLVAFYSGHILSDLAWYSLVAVAVASGRRLIGERFYRGLTLGCGAFLLLLGGYFIASGLRGL